MDHLGQFLVEHGWVSTQQLAAALAKVDPERLATLAIAKGILLREEVDHLREAYGPDYVKLGKKAVQEGGMSQAQLDCLLRMQKNDPQALGHALIDQGTVTAEAFSHALDEFQKHQQRFAIQERPLPPEYVGRADVVALVGMTELMFTETTGIGGVMSPTELRSEATLEQCFVAATDLSGDYGGKFVLVLETKLADRVCRSMTGLGLPEATQDDLADAVVEICNIIVGSAATALASRGHDLRCEPPRPLMAFNRQVNIGQSAYSTFQTGFGKAEIFVE
ncbi:MAG: chemotaxis protein CheX [Myxococcota bacterium]